jgi:Protein of unknown function (DUF2469)
MKADELEELEASQALDLRDQYRAAFPLYRYEVTIPGERLYLANHVRVNVMEAGDAAYFEITLTDAWVWSSVMPVRTLGKVLIHTFDTVTVEDKAPS